MKALQEALRRAMADIRDGEVTLVCDRGQTDTVDSETGLVTETVKTCTADDNPDDVCESCRIAWQLEEMRADLESLIV